MLWDLSAGDGAKTVCPMKRTPELTAVLQAVIWRCHGAVADFTVTQMSHGNGDVIHFAWMAGERDGSVVTLGI